MKIAILSSGLGHVARGIETWAADTARTLHDLGEEVTLFRGSGRPRAVYEKVCRSVRRSSSVNRLLNRVLPGPFWRAGLGNPYDIEQTTYALNLIPRLGRRYDIVHTQDPLAALILQNAHKLGLVRAPVILAHGTEEPFEFLCKIDYLQHLAPHHLEEARATGCWRETWTAIGNFVDTDVFHPGAAPALREAHGIGPDAVVVLSVAAVKRHHKRIDYLIDEVAALLERSAADVHLVVAGARTAQTDGLASSARTRLGSRAHFLLDQPRRCMPKVYRMGDVFALCSLKEMMPIALLEAAASGLPCLVSTHPVVAWMSGPGGEGVRMEQPGALSRALVAYLDAGHRHTKGQAARRHAVETFGKDVIVRRYLDMYDQVVRHAQGGLP
jgi:glycosyltransferase involved in cell wall biosynthesis